jgi:hypothetical protein
MLSRGQPRSCLPADSCEPAEGLFVSYVDEAQIDVPTVDPKCTIGVDGSRSPRPSGEGDVRASAWQGSRRIGLVENDPREFEQSVAGQLLTDAPLGQPRITGTA